MEPQEPKLFPELTTLETHFARLIERGERESALGALRCGLQEIARTVASRPELALKAHALLSAQDDAIAGHVGVGNGRAIALILNRIADQIRPGPQSSYLNTLHRPAAMPAQRGDIPSLEVNITSTGAITFAPVPAPNEKHDDE
ncbi:MAG: hypothetical protein WAU33_06800 [Candidatus Binataceae bacterium]